MMFTVREIVKATDGKLIQGPDDAHVNAVSIDSRSVEKGQVFIAVKGDVFDGHDFIKDVISRKVRVIIVHRQVAIQDPRVSVILVKDTIRALGHLALFHRLRFKIPVIALTGSAGKTTTKEMIAAVLGRKYRVLKNEGTKNNHIGVPLTLLQLKNAHQMVIMECGTNQPGDIPWLAEIVRPDAAVFTNIGESHLERLKTVQGVLKEKWHLTSFLPKQGRIIINSDDPLLFKKSKSQKRFKVISYGINAQSQFKAMDIQIIQGRFLRFKVHGETIDLNTCGIDNIYNALAAYVCGVVMSVPTKEIALALKKFNFPSGRGQIMKLGQGWLINDAYNANPVSVRSAIKTLQALDTQGRKIMIVADMLELGAKTKELHKQVGNCASKAGFDILITVGALSRHLAAEARRLNKKMQVFACADLESAQQHLARVLQNGDAVLVKGSRRMAMERVVEFLLKSPG